MNGLLLAFLWAALWAVFAPAAGWCANNGDQIVNRASLSAHEIAPMTSSVTVTFVQRTPSSIDFLKYAPGVAGASSLSVAGTSYQNASGTLAPVAAPTAAGSGGAIDLSGPVALLPFSTFHQGEPLFIRVADPDQNLDRGRAETVLVTVTDSKTGDSETLQLTESGPDTGVFIGYLQTSSAAGAPHDGVLYVLEDSSITARYTDVVDGSDSSTTAALVDPFGIVFDSRTGLPVDGATVELLNADGTPAAVLGDDGAPGNSFPNSVKSGGTATDRSGRLYAFNPGGYRFPFVAPGSYLLKVTPPAAYGAPSTVATTKLQALPGAPFTILEPGSRGELFSVPTGPAIRVDLPIDPKTGVLWLRKSAGKSIVAIGEYLHYDVTLENTDPVGSVFNAAVVDRLPQGFRYQKGSARINGKAVADPAVSTDGGTLTFAVGDVAPKSSVVVSYVTGVGAGARPGTAVNVAVATSTPSVSSNAASASVGVQEPFLQSRSILMGRVIVGACSDNPEDQKKGMPGIGIYLEDGTFVISDQRGMFHFEGVHAGTHVVQLDIDSVPEGYEVLPCEQNSRFAGRAFSQFVDLQGGTMWRTDFYLAKKGEKPALAPVAPLSAEELTLKALERRTGVTAAASAEELTLKALEGRTGVPADALKAGASQQAGAAELTSPGYRGEITLEMISSQDGNYIDYRVELQATSVPLDNLQLSVTLPPGAVYHKGSSRFGGAPCADPQVAGEKLNYDLGSAGTDWQKELRFRVSIDRKAKAGELKTRAGLRFDSPTARGVWAPEVDNLLTLVKEEGKVKLPPIVLHPQFDTFSAELSDSDRKQLDELAQVLSRFKIEGIDVTGHTDLVPIAQRSRKVYQDNTALSFSRAKSVGRYLTAKLHLPPESLNLEGKGEKEPIASNRTDSGRALNRRVRVNVTLSQTVETARLSIIKEREVKKFEVTGAPLGQMLAAPQGLAPVKAEELSLQVKGAAGAVAGAGAGGAGAGAGKGAGAGGSAVGAGVADAGGAASGKDQKDTKDLKDTKEGGKDNKDKGKGSAKKDEERVELVAALADGTVHYRVKLAGVKGPFQKVTATLATPKNLLYMTGTSKLSGTAAPDPDTKEGSIAYTFAKLPDPNRFDLRLQTLLDGDDQGESQPSSVTVQLLDDEGKPLKSFSATAELSDNMDDVTRPDLPEGAGNAAAGSRGAKDAAEQLNEFTEKVPPKKGEKVEDAPDSGLRVTENPGIISPADGSLIATQVNAIRAVLPSGLTPVLTVDGKEVSPERIGFKMKDRDADKTLYTYLGVDFGAAGEHVVRLKGNDSFGLARFDQSATVTRTGEIASIRFVSAEGNIADGRTPVKLRVQLFDADGKLVQANAELSLKGGELRPLSATGNLARETGAGASTVAVDAQGWIKFQPVTASGLYRVQLGYNKVTADIETYVKPVMRNWILVGLAEGTVGYQTASGHLEGLKASGEHENFYDKERLAFYAKGTIKGEWLLTMAYDSAKESTGVGGNSLFQNIDPNSFYTVYGDGSAQSYDASSQKKLYIKVERDQFYAMFGDYDTGLTVTELSRYSRRLNGVKTEARGQNFEVTAFGSETGQAFVKDEIRGDGTSGLYRLSRKGIVINSERITVESRDRFHSETVTDSKPMTRFIDYSIDYDAGTIFFKGPIANRDQQLNPVYIVVDYEVASAGQDALTLGGRAGARLLDGRLKVGGTYIHEGQVVGSNNLYGADASMAFTPETKARVEFATSENGSGLASSNNGSNPTPLSGNAYLAEVTHSDRSLDGKAYFRQQDTGFGLGQQMGSESGTRKFGAEGSWKLSPQSALSGQAYRQYNLATGATRDFIEALGSYTEKQYSARAGLSYAKDTLSDGSEKLSLLGRVGASWKSLNQKLTLRADHEQALFGKNANADFPTRTVLGADYQATKEILLFAQQELTFAPDQDTNTTRVGAKATPWSGGTVATSVANDMRENGERTFATVGLAQKWQVNPEWAVDGALDRNQTIRRKEVYTLNANVPPASGGEDFTAVSLGANYQLRKLTWANRVEFRHSDTENKWGLITGVMNEQGVYWGWTGKLQVLHTQGLGVSKTDVDIRLGLAYRPPVTRWILLDRLDLIASDEKGIGSSTRGRRIVNNLNANYRPSGKSQFSLQYGAKYVLERIDEGDWGGFTDLIGAEGRYDLTKKWDLGLRGSLLHSWALGQVKYSLGASVGCNLMTNAWVSLGYNLIGFQDRDFSAANFTAQGPFVQFRVKFDQQTVKDGLKALHQ